MPVNQLKLIGRFLFVALSALMGQTIGKTTVVISIGFVKKNECWAKKT